MSIQISTALRFIELEQIMALARLQGLAAVAAALLISHHLPAQCKWQPW
jgi:hypothetical protein